MKDVLIAEYPRVEWKWISSESIARSVIHTIGKLQSCEQVSNLCFPFNLEINDVAGIGAPRFPEPQRLSERLHSAVVRQPPVGRVESVSGQCISGEGGPCSASGYSGVKRVCGVQASLE